LYDPFYFYAFDALLTTPEPLFDLVERLAAELCCLSGVVG
jgi:hypothetical protein